MPSYYKGYYKGKKRYFRKYHKKRGSKFSKFNTYRKRSAKAQANQIYSLNKKINNMYRITKPRIFMADSDNYKFNNYDPSHPSPLETGNNIFAKGSVDVTTTNGRYFTFPHYYNSGFVDLFKDINVMVNDNLSTGDTKTYDAYVKDVAKGTDLVRLKNGIIYLSFEPSQYCLPIAPTAKPSAGFEDNEVPFQGFAALDLYIVQTKTATIPDSEAISSFFGTNYISDSSKLPNFQAQTTYSYLNPLNSSCWKYYTVLKHKRIIVNGATFKQHKVIKMKFTPKIKTIKTINVGSNGELFPNGIKLFWRVVMDADKTGNGYINAGSEANPILTGTFTNGTGSLDAKVITGANFYTAPVSFKYRLYFYKKN